MAQCGGHHETPSVERILKDMCVHSCIYYAHDVCVHGMCAVHEILHAVTHA